MALDNMQNKKVEIKQAPFTQVNSGRTLYSVIKVAEKSQKLDSQVKIQEHSSDEHEA